MPLLERKNRASLKECITTPIRLMKIVSLIAATSHKSKSSTA